MPSDTPPAPDAALREPAQLARWLDTLEQHSAYLYDRLTPADLRRIDAISAILDALSRDGGADGWRAGAEAMREAAATGGGNDAK